MKKSAFEHINFGGIKLFIQILQSTKDVEKEYLILKYGQRYENYKNVFEFLMKMNFISEIKGNIVLRKELSDAKKDTNFRIFLLKMLCNPDSFCYKEVRDYLDHFESINGEIECSITTKERLAYSNIRNLLIELDFIKLQGGTNKYVVNKVYHSMVYGLVDGKKALTPDGLELIHIRQSQLGKRAEILVVDFEKQRLREFPNISDEVEYVAEVNVNAGYDISSFTMLSDGKRIKRYIEVKAVSHSDFRFYWSSNEIDKAKQYGESYFLYLIPVVGINTFDIEKMEIIGDPFNIIFKNTNKWVSSVEEYCLWKIK